MKPGRPPFPQTRHAEHGPNLGQSVQHFGPKGQKNNVHKEKKTSLRPVFPMCLSLWNQFQPPWCQHVRKCSRTNDRTFLSFVFFCMAWKLHLNPTRHRFSAGCRYCHDFRSSTFQPSAHLRRESRLTRLATSPVPKQHGDAPDLVFMLALRCWKDDFIWINMD